MINKKKRGLAIPTLVAGILIMLVVGIMLWQIPAVRTQVGKALGYNFSEHPNCRWSNDPGRNPPTYRG